MIRDLVDGALDLLLGGCCVGCGRPGRALCPRLRGGAAHPRPPRVADPGPRRCSRRPGRPPSTPTRSARWCSRTRSTGCSRSARRCPGCWPRRSTRRVSTARWCWCRCRRGPPPCAPAATTPPARSRPRRRGWCSATAVPLLRTRPGLQDQAGLDAGQRAANLAGSLHCPAAGLRRLARRVPRARVVVCDDVITTGATAREAQRALESVGLEVAAIAAVAATGTAGRDLPPFRSHQCWTNVSVWSPFGSVVASSRGSGKPGRHVGKPMPVAGETVHVTTRRGAGTRRGSRCGLVVSPASAPSSDATDGREKASSGREAAKASAGDCGVEDQVGRTDSSACPDRTGSTQPTG